MKKKIKVAFAIPTEGHTNPESFHKIRLMAFHHGVIQERSKHDCNDVEFEFFDMTVGRILTAVARDRLADTALAHGADYLFMIDDDMIPPADLFERLYRHNVDIVAPLAFTRNAPHLAVLYQTAEGWDPIAKRAYDTCDWIRNWPRNKLVECDAVGFGSVLIKTAVLKKMQRPYFMCSSGTGEDLWFCLKAKKEAGARVFMDTSTEIGHVGAPIIIDSRTHELYNDPVEQEKLHGPYKRHGIFDVSHFEKSDSKEPEVLAL